MSKYRRLEQTVARIQKRHGAKALRKGSALLAPALPPHVSTGFPQLDEITGCHGIPRGALTFSGYTTSGKLTVGYETLVKAQQAGQRQASPTVGILAWT